jgi:hypothetical protein
MTEGTRRQAVSNLVDTNTLIERICLTSGIDAVDGSSTGT